MSHVWFVRAGGIIHMQIDDMTFDPCAPTKVSQFSIFIENNIVLPVAACQRYIPIL